MILIQELIVGDNPDDLNDLGYGDNNVIGPFLSDAGHGTHVSGIIASNRNDNSGSKGIYNNLKIMVLRAVPDGDEYDKDVALAIRYAVDNGACVINTSFGKVIHHTRTGCGMLYVMLKKMTC